jgi:hypothetical protein
MSDRQPDPTRIEAATDGGTESTVDVPARWSGSAAVPPPSPKRSRWTRRLPADEDGDPADRETIPPVDPWAGQDTPWDPMPLPPPPEPLPPTRIELPPAPAAAPPARPMPPPARPMPPPARPMPPPARPMPAPARPTPPPARPMPPPPPKHSRWQKRPAPQANRIPVAPRPAPPPRPLPPPPPRRRRRWPRRLALFTLLSAVCCCGIPAYFGWPAASQYPVSAILPGSVSDLNLRDDRASRRAAEHLAAELNDTEAFAGVYSDGNGKRVTIFGVTGLRLTPEQDVQAQIDSLTAEYDIRDVKPFDLGVSGVHERCGVGRSGGSTVVVCAWADHGSLATVLLTRRSVADSAELTGVLRSAVLVRG